MLSAAPDSNSDTPGGHAAYMSTDSTAELLGLAHAFMHDVPMKPARLIHKDVRQPEHTGAVLVTRVAFSVACCASCRVLLHGKHVAGDVIALNLLLCWRFCILELLAPDCGSHFTQLTWPLCPVRVPMTAAACMQDDGRWRKLRLCVQAYISTLPCFPAQHYCHLPAAAAG